MGRPFALPAFLNPEFGLFVIVDLVCCLSHVRKDFLDDNMQQTVLIIQAQGIPKCLGSHPEIYLNK